MNSAPLRVGEWQLNVEQHSLTCGDEVRVIGAQNMALLQYFAAHPNQLITRDTLLSEVWQGVIVNDNTLSKAVAELRKALGDEHRQSRYIVTVPRQGYRLIASVHIDDSTATPSADNATRFRPLLGWSLGFVAALLALWAFWPTPGQDDTKPRFSRLVPATSTPGAEMQPSFSPDGQWLVYVRYAEGDSHGVIELKDLHSGQLTTLVAKPEPVSNSARLEQPVWSPHGSHIAYLAHDENGCQVRLVRLQSSRTQVDDDTVIGDCAAQTLIGFNTLRWADNGDSLYVYQQHEGSLVLVKLDWQQGTTTVLATPPSYVFAAHPKKPLLAYASATMLDSVLNRYDVDQQQASVVLQRREIFFGLAFDPLSDDLITTSSLVGGQLEVIEPNGRQRVLWPSADPLIDPTFSADGRKLAITQVRFTYDLWSAALDNATAFDKAKPERQALIQSSRFDYSPRFSHSGERLAFISTRGGEPAVWFANADGSETKQAFTLPDQDWPVHLRWSPDDRYLSIGSTDFKVYRYDVIKHQLDSIADSTVLIMNPTWSADGSALYVARLVQEQWQIWRWPLQGEPAPLTHQNTVIDGLLAEESADGQNLYLLRYGNSEQRGVWVYRGDAAHAERLLAWPLNRHNWQNFQVSPEGFYFLHSDAGQYGIYHWRKDQAMMPLLNVISMADAGPLFINFAISPDQTRAIYTHIADFQSDIMILE